MTRLVFAGAALIAFGMPAPAAAQLSDQREVTGAPSDALRNICHISTQRSPLTIFASAYNSSGILYRGRYVITAAHNVYSPFYNPIVKLSVACGDREPGDAAHQEVQVSNSRVASDYGWVPKRYDRDFAIIKLAQPISQGLPVELQQAGANGGQGDVTLAGFPGRRGTRMNGRRMFVGTGPGSWAGGSPFLNYGIKTHTGNSGGPAYTVDNGTMYLVGVHVSGNEGGGRARIVDADFVTVVEAMIASLD